MSHEEDGKTITTDGLLISQGAQFNRLSGQLLDRKLVALGITLQEMRIAGLLMGESDMTQKALAEKLSVRPATLSVAISKLEEAGIVRRVTSAQDRRVNYLQLLPSPQLGKVDALLLNLEAAMCAGISDQEIEVTRKVLGQLNENLKQMYVAEYGG